MRTRFRTLIIIIPIRKYFKNSIKIFQLNFIKNFDTQNFLLSGLIPKLNFYFILIHLLLKLYLF